MTWLMLERNLHRSRLTKVFALVLLCYSLSMALIWISDADASHNYSNGLFNIRDKFKAIRMYIGDRIKFTFNHKVSYLCVLFTTFDQRANKPYHAYAHSISIMNWARLMPEIQPVLFSNNLSHSLVKEAMAAGWHVLRIPSTNKHGTPHLKPLYQSVFESYSSTFYGYSNGDIQFDHTLLQTIRMINSKLVDLKSNILLTGRRYNLDLNLNLSQSTYDGSNLKNLSKSAKQDSVQSEDYFILTHSGSSMNWTGVKDIVIGRPAVDNYLVARAVAMKVTAIDCTKTVLAVHLKTPNITHEGLQQKDADYNRKLIGSFRYRDGFTDALTLITAYDIHHKINIVFR